MTYSYPRRFPGPAIVEMPLNPAEGGRDFILPDLHGKRGALEAELKRVAFDTKRDRLFSVGDLIDRGDENLECLELLRESWFFPVLANHETMMLSALVGRESLKHGPLDWTRNGGDWFYDLTKEGKTRLSQLLPLLVHQPLVRVVQHAAGAFNVVHAGLVDRITGDVLLNDDLDEETLERNEDEVTWGRRLVSDASRKGMRSELDLGNGEVVNLTGAQMLKGLRLTYVGHTPMKECLLHLSHFHCDLGSGHPNGRLLLQEHGVVATRLRDAGVL